MGFRDGFSERPGSRKGGARHCNRALFELTSPDRVMSPRAERGDGLLEVYDPVSDRFNRCTGPIADAQFGKKRLEV